MLHETKLLDTLSVHYSHVNWLKLGYFITRKKNLLTTLCCLLAKLMLLPWVLSAQLLHSDKKSKNQTGNSAAMFIKPKNHKIDLILPWRCFLEFLAFYFFLNVKRMFCYEVEFENRALETQENSTMVKLNQFWRYFV